MYYFFYLKVHVHYLPGKDNWAADQLSRWRRKGIDGFTKQNEEVVDLSFVLDPVLRAQELYDRYGCAPRMWNKGGGTYTLRGLA